MHPSCTISFSHIDATLDLPCLLNFRLSTFGSLRLYFGFLDCFFFPPDGGNTWQRAGGVLRFSLRATTCWGCSRCTPSVGALTTPTLSQASGVQVKAVMRTAWHTVLEKLFPAISWACSWRAAYASRLKHDLKSPCAFKTSSACK